MAGRTAECLRAEWSSFVVATLQQDLDEHFNFFEEDRERYSFPPRHSLFFLQLPWGGCCISRLCWTLASAKFLLPLFY